MQIGFGGAKPREAKPFTRSVAWRSFTRPAGFESEGIEPRHVRPKAFYVVYAARANEKFYLSPTSQHVKLTNIIGKFGGADQLRNAVIKTYAETSSNYEHFEPEHRDSG
jgi:hypothetical protein